MIRTIKHYSKALLELGKALGILDELLADLKNVNEKINTNLDLKKYLLDPQIKFEKKKQALRIVFQNFINEKTYNFLFILIKDKRLNYLNKIIEDTIKKRKEKENLLEAIIESVVPLESMQENMIKQMLAEKTNKQILIKNLINADLIAGLRIKLEDVVIDNSVQGKIERLRNKISELS